MLHGCVHSVYSSRHSHRHISCSMCSLLSTGRLQNDHSSNSARAIHLPEQPFAGQCDSPFRIGVGGGTDARHARKGGGKAARTRHVEDSSNGVICVSVPPRAELKILAHTNPAGRPPAITEVCQCREKHTARS